MKENHRVVTNLLASGNSITLSSIQNAKKLELIGLILGVPMRNTMTILQETVDTPMIMKDLHNIRAELH